MPHSGFVPLRIFSSYTMLDGAIDPKAIAAQAKANAFPAAGLTDRNGLYAAMTAQHPYLDEASQPIRFWANKYKTKFNEDPTVFSVYGYNAVDIFLRAAQKAGPNLSTDSFIKAMDTMTVAPDMFGSPEMTFTAQKRLGNDASRLSQIQDGKWKVVSDYIKP